MKIGIDWLKQKLDDKQIDDLKKLVGKSNAEKKSPDEIKAEILARFKKDLEIQIEDLDERVIVFIKF